MAVVGIIAEFNPLHSGHKLIIDAAKKEGNTVICAVSGNFVQRGDTAIIPKFHRAHAALLCGADLVCEIPVLWSMSTAYNFALGGVFSLYNLGCEKIIFGSESGDINKIKNTAEILFSKKFKELLSEHLKRGVTFAVARDLAADELGADTQILKGANDNLGVEYILAAKRLGISIQFDCIKRQGAGHDSLEVDCDFVSASYIREKIKSGDFEDIKQYTPKELDDFIKEDFVSDISIIEAAILSVLRTKTPKDLKSLPDISEGLENKIYFASRVAISLDGLYNEIKSKRYTLARIRRLVLSAFLGFDNSFFLKPPPYVRILGFDKKGQNVLKNLNPIVPVITKVSQINDLSDDAKKVFDTECRAGDLYALSLKNPQVCGAEYKTKLIKMEW